MEDANSFLIDPKQARTLGDLAERHGKTVRVIREKGGYFTVEFLHPDDGRVIEEHGIFPDGGTAPGPAWSRMG